MKLHETAGPAPKGAGPCLYRPEVAGGSRNQPEVAGGSRNQWSDTKGAGMAQDTCGYCDMWGLIKTYDYEIFDDCPVCGYAWTGTYSTESSEMPPGGTPRQQVIRIYNMAWKIGMEARIQGDREKALRMLAICEDATRELRRLPLA